MSKEEILKKHIQNYYHYKGKSVADDDILPVSRIKPLMDEFAQEKAKSEAITFAEWINKNAYNCYDEKDGYGKGWYLHKGMSGEIFTTSQLYDLYAKSKK